MSIEADICAGKHHGDAASVAAHQRSKFSETERQAWILRRIRAAGSDGLTSFELAAMATDSRRSRDPEAEPVSAHRITPTLSRLAAEGLIRKSGRSRPNSAGNSCNVWVVESGWAMAGGSAEPRPVFDRDGRLILTSAEGIADALVDLIRPACEMVVVSGDVRERRPWVRSIELIVRPRVRRDLFGRPDGSELDDVLERMIDEGKITRGDCWHASRVVFSVPVNDGQRGVRVEIRKAV